MRRLVVALMLLLALVPGFIHAATTQPANPAKKQDTPLQEPPMRFDIIRLSSTACEPLCPEWISAEGRIMPNTAGTLAALLKNADYRKLPILINSGGGSIESAVAMGRTIRKYQMTTAVGKTFIFGCPEADRLTNKCKLDAITKTYNGMAMPIEAYCASACPLMLLGGTVRVIEPYALVGLHEPRAESHPYVDQYRLLYRIEGGHKHLISKTFFKRTYMAKKEVVGITPALRHELVPFLKDMGGDPAILTEMDKATPRDMNWIKPNTGERERLGLTSNGGARVTASFESLTSAKSCKADTAPLPNCIFFKEKTPVASAPPTPTVAQPKSGGGTCFLVGGCNYPPVQQATPAATPCFILDGCGKINGPQLVRPAETKCYVMSGCS